MRQVVTLADNGGFTLELSFFRHAQEKIDYTWEGGAPVVGRLFGAKLEELLGPARKPDEALTDRHRDIARSTQAMYETAFFHLLNRLHGRHRLDALTLAGGCAMNSVANGKVRRMTPFKRLYVQSAAGDAGGAIGAAMYVSHQLNTSSIGSRPSALAGDKVEGRFVMDHAYCGPRRRKC